MVATETMEATKSAARQEETDRLLDAARGGDDAAASRLLEAYRPLILGYLRSRTRNPEDRDDLTQNVFLRASRNLAAFRNECPISQWLLRIAANELKNYYERTVSTRPMTVGGDFDWENALALQHSDPTLGPYTEAEDRSLVDQLVATAKEVCGSEEFAVLMMFYQGESFEAISGLLQIKAATVRSHFLRARGKLLAHLVVNEPTLLGGASAIKAAIETAKRDGALDEREAIAFSRFDPRSELCRAACIKVARHLPIPIAILFWEGMWTN